MTEYQLGPDGNIVTPADYSQVAFMEKVNFLAAQYAQEIGYHPNPIMSDMLANFLALIMALPDDNVFMQVMSKAQTQAEEIMHNRKAEATKAALRKDVEG
jgi:hypothetical protein